MTFDTIIYTNNRVVIFYFIGKFINGKIWEYLILPIINYVSKYTLNIQKKYLLILPLYKILIAIVI